ARADEGRGGRADARRRRRAVADGAPDDPARGHAPRHRRRGHRARDRRDPGRARRARARLSERLHSPESHEPLTDERWDEERVRAAIRAVVADADAAHDDEALWPGVDEWDTGDAQLPL